MRSSCCRIWSRSSSGRPSRQAAHAQAVISVCSDGRRLVYMTTSPSGTSEIKKTSLEGGPVVQLLELRVPPRGSGAHWWRDDEIILSLDNRKVLARLSADGGEP